MSVSYGWFLAVSFGEAGARELVKTMPNDGLTEKLGGRWVDVFMRDGALCEEPADVGPALDELERRLARGGSMSAPLASRLGLGGVICLELPKTARGRELRFREWRVRDLDDALATVEEAIDALGKKSDATLEALHACLHRAQQLHVAVVFGV